MNERRFLLDTEQHRDNAARFIGRMEVETVKEVIVRDYVRQRSTSQNARLWALHSLAAAHTGHSAEEMHEFALCRHFGSKEITVGGVTRQIPLKRSSQRDRKEFGEFMEATEAWYIDEFGVWLDQREAA